MQPLAEVKSRKARCCTPCPDMAAIKRTIAKYICCIPTTLILGIIAAFRASQHSFYSVHLLFFLFPIAMVPLLKLILKKSWVQYTRFMLCVFACGMTAILATNLESMVSFGNEEWRTRLVDTIGEFTARGEVTFAQDVENTFVAAVVDQAMSYNPISSTLVFPFLLLNFFYAAFVIVPFQYIVLPQMVHVKDGPCSAHSSMDFAQPHRWLFSVCAHDDVFPQLLQPRAVDSAGDPPVARQHSFTLGRIENRKGNVVVTR